MDIAVRTEHLRKIYTTPPPIGAERGVRLPLMAKRPKTQNYEVVALADLNLEIKTGEVFGLLGPNGAGKSTAVSILTTRARANSGRAWVLGIDVAAEPVRVKRVIGVVAQRPNLDFSLTARENLTFHAAYFGISKSVREARADRLLEQFQLSGRSRDLVSGFSGGMMQRLLIARALMHDPDVLFLDEPSSGLDPQTRLLLWDLIREYNRQGKTILITTHNMDEADVLSHRIGIIDHGQLIALGTPAELKRSIPGGYMVEVRFRGDGAIFAQDLRALPKVREVQANTDTMRLYADDGGALIPEVVQTALRSQISIQDIHISEPNLENLFLHHTGRSLRS